MKKICIDAVSHGSRYNGLMSFIVSQLGIKEDIGQIDLTEGDIYTVKFCGCGEHFVVDKDDVGDTDVTYAKERFDDVPCIEEIEVMLKEKLILTDTW